MFYILLELMKSIFPPLGIYFIDGALVWQENTLSSILSTAKKKTMHTYISLTKYTQNVLSQEKLTYMDKTQSSHYPDRGL